jgi:hypothetical protein
MSGRSSNFDSAAYMAPVVPPGSLQSSESTAAYLAGVALALPPGRRRANRRHTAISGDWLSSSGDLVEEANAIKVGRPSGCNKPLDSPPKE